MANCNVGVFSGLADVICQLGKINGIMVTEKGTAFTDATFIAPSTHHVGIASITTASRTSMVYPMKRGYENTTDDITIQTSNLGYKEKDGEPIPSMVGMLDVGAVDYQTLQDLETSLWDIVLFTDKKKQVGCKNSSGSTKGFRARIAFKYGLPPSDNVQTSYPVYIFFDDADEFKNVVYASPSYSFQDLRDYVPVGLDMSITTAYATGTSTVIVKVVKRGTGVGLAGLVAADFEVLESNGTSVVGVVSIVDNGQGSYDVIIQEDTAGSANALESGEYYILQASDEDATPTYLTYLSNAIKETVV